MRRVFRVGSRTIRLAWATSLRLLEAELRALGRPPEEAPAIFAERLDRWAADVLRDFRVEPRIEGALPPRPAPGPRLVLANHRSFLDIPLMLRLFGGHHLSRADVADWPVVGRAARRTGTLFVERGDGRSGAQAVRDLRRALRERRTLLVFAEGGTFAGDEVQPFRAGALVAARGIPDVEVVPVGVAYPPRLDWHRIPMTEHLRRTAARPTIPVGVAVGPARPVPRDPRTGLPALQAEVQDLVRRARGAVPGDGAPGPERAPRG